VSVLVVCTANVCRSPLAARLLSVVLDVPVTSAGVRAVPGHPACPASAAFTLTPARSLVSLPASPPFPGDHALRGDHARPGDQRSVLLEAGHVRSASLVLGAAREHRSAAIALVPNAQRKAFTLLQAARLAAFLQAEGVSAPARLTGEERLAWWVDELDAVRGDAPRVDAREDDLPDPHEDGARHEVVLPRLADAVELLASVVT
jgi:protein-tyrosine phosphatase